MPLFWRGSPEALLKFFTLLHKIIRVQDLFTVPQKFSMTRNMVVRKALWAFEKKTQDRGTEMNAKYDLVIKDFISHFFPPKALQCQKRYLQGGLYKPCDTSIR